MSIPIRNFPAQGGNFSVTTEYVMSSEDRARLAQVVDSYYDADIMDSDYRARAMAGSVFLPPALVRTVREFGAYGDAALHIRNAPLGRFGPTPTDPRDPATRRTMIAAAGITVLALLAYPVAYEAECSGRLVQGLLPTAAHKWEQRSDGSMVCLECHTEQAFNPRSRPDYIVLACLRGDPLAETYVMSARQVMGLLSPEDVALLRDKVFLTLPDASFVSGGLDEAVRGPFAVFSGSEVDPVMTYDEDMMWTESAPHQEALERLAAVWANHRISVILQPGEILLIDNSRAIHGRSAYPAQFDGGDRWLARAQGLCSPTVLRQVCGPNSWTVPVGNC